MNRSTASLAALAVMFNALAWGLAWWPFRQLEARGLHALWATGFVYVLAIVGLMIWRANAWRGLVQTPRLWILVLASGVTNAAFNWGITVGDVVRVVLLFYLMPAWSMLLAWGMLGERPTRTGLAQLALAWAGVALVLLAPSAHTSSASNPALGDTLAIIGGMSFALTNVMLRQLADSPTEHRSFAMFAGGASCSVAVALVGGAVGLVAAPSPDVGAWLPLAAALAVWFIASNLSLQYGAARLPARTKALVLTSEVLFASASAVALGAAVLAGQVLLGGALIIGAALWASLGTESSD
jgi:drug/metabolite transporter (DMT)-like permease